MVIKVLGISGSPHRHGNTETLLDSFLDGAREAGAEVEKIVLKEITCSSCRGCNACHKTGESGSSTRSSRPIVLRLPLPSTAWELPRNSKA
jgi:multimeric flavodoxin WrbA